MNKSNGQADIESRSRAKSAKAISGEEEFSPKTNLKIIPEIVLSRAMLERGAYTLSSFQGSADPGTLAYLVFAAICEEGEVAKCRAYWEIDRREER
jgi:hypothetical protein